MEANRIVCAICGHEIAGAFLPHPFGPECGPPAPVHYACRLREIKAREQDRRRLEAAAPALLEACRAFLQWADGWVTRPVFEVREEIRAAVALAEPPEGGPHP
jgi:hypothetical protein